jgi:collagenase-like PrtC family protease
MKVLSPLSKAEEIKPLAEAGADEFYCGVVTKEWEKRFSYIASINLRHDKVANFQSYEALSKAVQAASQLEKPVFCVFNAHFYSENQLPFVEKEITQAFEAGVSKIIVSDIGLISSLRERGFGKEIALSTAFPAFNSAAFPLFKSLGIKRIVLPRHLSVKEIVGLAASASKQGLELEAFVLNALCPYIDGLCTLQHVGKSQQSLSAKELACRMPFKARLLSQRRENPAALLRSKAWQGTLTTSCGLCALPLFEKAGIYSLKIAGRANPLEKKLSDVRAVKEAISLIPKLSKQEFRDEMKRLFFKENHQSCDFISCYYPEEGLNG